jgi:hypothetical protein
MGFIVFQILVVLAVVSMLGFFHRDDAATRLLRACRVRKEIVFKEIKRR